MDPVTTAHAISHEGPWGAVKTWGILAALAFIAHDAHDHSIYMWAVGVCAILASPTLAQKFIAPRLAALLKETPQ